MSNLTSLEIHMKAEDAEFLRTTYEALVIGKGEE